MAREQPEQGKREAFGKRFSEAMAQAGLNGVRLADLTKLSGAAISRWKSGERIPGAEELVIAAAALGVRSEWLVTGKGPRQAPVGSDGDPVIRQLESWARANMPGNGVSEEVLGVFVASTVIGGGVEQTLDDLYADLLSAARAAKRGRFRVVSDEEAQARQTMAAGGSSEEEIEEEMTARREGSKPTS